MNLLDNIRDFVNNRSKIDFDWGKEYEKTERLIHLTNEPSTFERAYEFDIDTGLMMPFDLMILLLNRWIQSSDRSNKSLEGKIYYLSCYGPSYENEISDLKSELELNNRSK